MREWETPTNVKDIRSFLGVCYYRWVPSYALAPLTMLITTRGTSLAVALYAPLLIYSDPSLVYIGLTLEMAGGVLMQEGKALAFMYRAFKPQ